MNWNEKYNICVEVLDNELRICRENIRENLEREGWLENIDEIMELNKMVKAVRDYIKDCCE